MTSERIEDFREIVLPFLSGTLLRTNYENMGKSDAEEFEKDFNEILDLAIKALEQKPTIKNDLGVDCISRADARSLVVKIGTKDIFGMSGKAFQDLYKGIDNLPPATPQEPKTGHCKDCKWWKDSDGKYRRGIGAESQCPLNTHAVYCGDGYCYMFSPNADMRGEEE